MARRPDKHFLRQPARLPDPKGLPIVVTGEMLWRALGFRNERAFQRAHAAGKLPVRLYRNPKAGSGFYAVRRDLERAYANNLTSKEEPT